MSSFEDGLTKYCSKKINWHFVCTDCEDWWSIAANNDWEPNELYCPHCGLKQSFE